MNVCSCPAQVIDHHQMQCDMRRKQFLSLMYVKVNLILVKSIGAASKPHVHRSGYVITQYKSSNNAQKCEQYVPLAMPVRTALEYAK